MTVWSGCFGAAFRSDTGAGYNGISDPVVTYPGERQTVFPRSEQEIFSGTERAERFDAASGRRILERAVAEQHRLQQERDDSYSLEEIEEMAAEAGISREALQSALQRRSADRARGWSSARWLKNKWTPLLAGLATVTLFGLMLAFPAVAYFMLGVAIAAAVLILLGASPL